MGKNSDPGSSRSDENQTSRLRDARQGDDDLGEVFRIVEEGLRHRARKMLDRGRPDAIVDTTGLIQEAYLRVMASKGATWKDRGEFYGYAATTMQRILVDLYRKNQTQKRGGGLTRVPLCDGELFADERGHDLVALDDALSSLAEVHPLAAKVVTLRYFGGCSVQETADALETSVSAVRKQWELAKSWLFRELGGDDTKTGNAAN